MLKDNILQFLNNPNPIWETELTKDLVNAELAYLSQFELDLTNYSTQRSYFKKNIKIEEKPILISGISSSDSIYLEYPQVPFFNFFYEEHGLEPENKSEIDDCTFQKLKKALDVFKQIPGANICISSLVKRIQVLKQFDDEIDTSYSHPLIPFSIFISLCTDSSTTSSLRVAESILHEAMHLKLTLIEKHIDLIKPDTLEKFYSPWRDEQRPLRGVLHGLFVFKSVFEMYKFLCNNSKDYKNTDHIYYRMEDITEEFRTIKNLALNNGFTEAGANFVNNLLPSS
ncbi:aKG-HExxH-type peptide beta-hydroxylase [Chryseobacterium soli]|uniref:aKG-HExxH-type peptide beta-hydroxylase n=1 Tax=Chryseobacterium soli TaxID=445961 RepID=UPI000B1752DE|nr:HEXXH motif-containing putative peptide modification protein [Chryseobacterium soli]